MKDRDIFLIADTHFGHSNVITFRDEADQIIRKFDSIKDHDDCICDNWVSVVKPQDIVYHLGDVHFNKDKEKVLAMLKSLPGQKRLILGNHDILKDKVIAEAFSKITMWRVFRPYKAILTHVPIYFYGGLGRDGIEPKFNVNIHGHIHQNPSPTDKHKCVSVEHIDYTPVKIQDVLNTERMM